jgi:ribose transport system permease protein
MIGVLILSVLQNILILTNISSFYQEIARGAVILLAVYLDTRNKQNSEKKILRITDEVKR